MARLKLQEQYAEFLPVEPWLEEIARDAAFAVALSSLGPPQVRDAGSAVDKGNSFSGVLNLDRQVEVLAHSCSKLRAFLGVLAERSFGAITRLLIRLEPSRSRPHRDFSRLPLLVLPLFLYETAHLS
jgi:hypothetical protein